MTQVNKKDLNSSFMLVIEDRENVAKILDLNEHEFNENHLVVFFNKDIRDQLQTGDLPILHKFGKDNQYFKVDLEFAQFIHSRASWITIFYDKPDATTIRTTIPKCGFILDPTD